MNRSGITVVTPSLNQERYIRVCLESVRKQQFPDVEHLVIDGGSTDGTRDIVESFENTTFIELAGSSQSEALNWGFKNAKYPTICWLNSDDLLLEGAFTSVIRQCKTLPARWYLFSSFIEIDSNDEVKKVRLVPYYLEHAIRNFATYVPTSGSFFSRSVVNDGLLLDGDLHYLMDRDFIVRLSRKGYRIQRSNHWLAGFRIHDEQKSGKGFNEASRYLERNKLNEQHGGIWIENHRLTQHSKLLETAFKCYVGASWKASQFADQFSLIPEFSQKKTNAQLWIDSLVTR